jgi:hypothetical protein
MFKARKWGSEKNPGFPSEMPTVAFALAKAGSATMQVSAQMSASRAFPGRRIIG